jgi:hypothetical protein
LSLFLRTKDYDPSPLGKTLPHKCTLLLRPTAPVVSKDHLEAEKGLFVPK